jgi:ribonuclease P protein component
VRLAAWEGSTQAPLTAKVTSLRTKGDFTRCYRAGRRAANDLLRVYALPHPAESGGRRVIRLGVPIPRRMGTAVSRNRIRRVLREACRHFVADARGNWDVVIVPQPPARGAAAETLRSALRQLLAAVGLGG